MIDSTATRTNAQVELHVAGMTCTSCATRVERKLNKIDGVTATVNYATEQASVGYDPTKLGPEELVDAVAATGYRASVPAAEAGRAGGAGDQRFTPPDPDQTELASLRRRLMIGVPLAIPVLVLAMVPSAEFDGWQWLSLALASVVVWWGGWPFHRATLLNLRHGATTMDTLVSLGTIAAFGASLYALIFGHAGALGMRMHFTLTAGSGSPGDDLYLEVAAGVVLFLLIGRYLEARAKRRSGAALAALLHLGAKEVTVLRGGGEVRIPASQLLAGEIFVVRPGETIATDGVVIDGSSAVDESLLTGESVPIEVGPGVSVTGATINAGGRLTVRATRVGADTTLARISRLVQQAQSGKARVQRLADRVSGVFVPIVLALAVSTLVASLAAGTGAGHAFAAAVAVLIIACPCALGLATPTALLVGTGRGAQLGLLIRGPQVLEATRRVDAVLLDKTGTVTTGRMSLRAVSAAPDTDPDRLLLVAGALEADSEHPIGAAITSAARAKLGALPRVIDFAASAGLGVRGTVVLPDGAQRVIAGRPALLGAAGWPLDDQLQAAAQRVAAEGASVVAVGWDGAARGVLAVGDTIKDTSAEAIRRLRALGLRPMLLTGDNPAAARAVARDVGIDEADVIADVLPEGKVAAVRAQQARGAVVAMVGDGVNDAAALAAADLGLSMGTGTDVAIEASDITLVRGDLTAAADAIRLSRRTLRTIRQNLLWAFGYNVILIPVAAAGLLSPLLAGAAMAASSVLVVSNSLRLRRFHP